MRPVIGIFPSVDDEQLTRLLRSYTKSIEDAGGLPLILPYTENEEILNSYIDLCQGFVFSGGVDIAPERFGEEIHPSCGTIHKYRDQFECIGFEEVMKTGKPILGICRGCQVINVFLGGSLYQDIPSQLETTLPHRQTEPKTQPSHPVLVTEGTPLYELTGKDKIEANSFHHQAIKALGEGLQVMARAEDGIIEAVFMPSHRYLRAYQWHPERLYEINKDNRAIFEDFISACEKIG